MKYRKKSPMGVAMDAASKKGGKGKGAKSAGKSAAKGLGKGRGAAAVTKKTPRGRKR